MRYIFFLILATSVLFSAKLNSEYWKKGETFSEYLLSRNISSGILASISKEDIKFLSEIQAKQLFYELKNTQGILEQALIPIGIEMQIRLAKAHDSDSYSFDIIPIEYKEQEHFATISIEKNLHTDINKALKHAPLADKMGQLFENSVDARRFHKGDTVSFVYTQKTRMGKPYCMPHIKIAKLDSRAKEQFIYADEDGYGFISNTKSQPYTVTGKKKVTYTRRVSVKSTASNFGMPLRHARITSSFSHRRYHPIKKRYRPHHGTDFGAKRGTPLLAVRSGKIIFSGRMNGYGKVVKIKHSGGYVSLYAHQSRIRAKKGQWVKKGQIIGYVGNTGRSTGPHLHFGLTKNGKWINPMRVLNKKSILKKFSKYKNVKSVKYKTVELKDAKANKVKLLEYLKEDKEAFIWKKYGERETRIKDEKQYRKL
ncbi:MAG: M23 family peptidase [Epsilonproteobacteria bacterium]|nr:MAG: M23 family peptidase [Campylobacterota bacterium]